VSFEQPNPHGLILGDRGGYLFTPENVAYSYSLEPEQFEPDKKNMKLYVPSGNLFQLELIGDLDDTLRDGGRSQCTCKIYGTDFDSLIPNDESEGAPGIGTLYLHEDKSSTAEILIPQPELLSIIQLFQSGDRPSIKISCKKHPDCMDGDEGSYWLVTSLNIFHRIN